MLKKEKETVVEDLKQKLGQAQSVFLARFSGINVKDINKLRTDFRESEVEYLVAKNTLIRRAVADTEFEKLDPYLEGPSALVISRDFGVTAAKIIKDFQEDHEGFQVKAGMMQAEVIDAAKVKELASLPTRDQLLAKLLGSMQSPVANFVYVLNETVARAVRILGQVAEAKQAKE